MSLIRSTLVVSFFTACSRVMGTIREMLLSHLVGASVISDAFVIALKLPNFFRRFFAEGAFNASFVPQVAGLIGQGKKDEAYRISQEMLNFMAWFLIGFVIFVLFFTKPFLLLTVPGLVKTPERFELAVTYTRMTFPYIFFISLVSLFSGILNSLNKFVAAAVVPILLNIVLIGALLAVPIWQWDPGWALCLGVFVAGTLQCLWMYIACRIYGFHFHLSFPRWTPDVKKVLIKMIPGSIGAGVMQINLLVDMAIASYLPTKCMSYLYYADRLNQLPLSVLGVAVSTVLLPTLSRHWRDSNKTQAVETQNDALLWSMQWTLPAASGLIILAYPIMSLIYEHGKFTASDVLQSAPVLAAFALGLPAYVAGKIFSTAFFAQGDTKTPVKVACFTMILNIIISLILLKPLQHVGIALATAITAWIYTLMLAFLLHRSGTHITCKESKRTLFAVIVMSLILWLPPLEWANDRLHCCSLVFIGCLAYSLLGGLLNMRAFEFMPFHKANKKILLKTPSVKK